MKLSDLTESMLRRHVSSEILKRGEEYRRRGAVENAVLRGDLLTADVQGSEYEPYRITLVLGKRDLERADCTCPYGEEWGGWCKHIAAVLLLAIHAPELIDEAPPLPTLLEPLDRNDLQTLLLLLAESQPDLVGEIARLAEQVSAAKAPGNARSAAPKAPAPLPPDAASLRRGVRHLLGSYDPEWGSYGQSARRIAVGFRSLLEPLRNRLENGDARGALVGLEAITDEFSSQWSTYDDGEGELSELFPLLAQLWAEALLTALTAPGGLTQHEETDWRKKLQAWDAQADDYGLDGPFAVPLEALRDGWDSLRLTRVLSGESVTPRPQSEFAIESLPDLDTARLDVLERWGRREEALRLARWAGKPVRAAQLLLAMGKVGAIEETVTPLLRRSDDALAIVELLDRVEGAGEAGARKQALRIASHSLDMPGAKHALGLWTRDAALDAGETKLARDAAENIIRTIPALPDWKRLEQIAGSKAWPRLRDELIADLVASRDALQRTTMTGAVDILLHENRLREALRLIEHDLSEDAERVADKALPAFPEPVLTLARKRADPIMNAGRSAGYEEAARWVGRAKTAYRMLGREPEWQSYYAALLAEHRRRHRLMPLLRALADEP